MPEKHFRKLMWLLAVVAGSVLALALLMEYTWHQVPCRFCIYQRVPFSLLFLVATLGLLLGRHLWIIACVRILLLGSISIAGMHLLIIGGFIRDPCSVPTKVDSLESFEFLLHSPPPCSVSKWNLFGIPIAAYNLLLSSAMLYVALTPFFERGSKNL